MLISFNFLDVDACPWQIRDRCRGVCVCAVWDYRGTSLHKWLGKLACGVVWDGCRSAYKSCSWVSGCEALTGRPGRAGRGYVLLGTSNLLIPWSQVGQFYLKSRCSLTFSLNKLTHLWFGRKASDRRGVEGRGGWWGLLLGTAAGKGRVGICSVRMTAERVVWRTVFTVTVRLRKKWPSETGKESDPENLILFRMEDDESSTYYFLFWWSRNVVSFSLVETSGISTLQT